MDTSERRLELVRNVRQEQERNSAAMRQRESFFYGGSDSYLPAPAPGQAVMSGFKLRFFIALVLFMAFMAMDKNNWAVLEVDSGTIYETISRNAKGFDFEDIFPYTVDD